MQRAVLVASTIFQFFKAHNTQGHMLRVKVDSSAESVWQQVSQKYICTYILCIYVCIYIYLKKTNSSNTCDVAVFALLSRRCMCMPVCVFDCICVCLTYVVAHRLTACLPTFQIIHIRNRIRRFCNLES